MIELILLGVLALVIVASLLSLFILYKIATYIEQSKMKKTKNLEKKKEV